MYPDFYTDTGKFYILSSGLTMPPATHIIKIYSPRIRLVFAPPKAKLFDITVEIF